jgi:hypothetical protein
MTTTAPQSERQDLHAALFAEAAALREVIVKAGDGGGHNAELSRPIGNAVADILRLPKALSRFDD